MEDEFRGHYATTALNYERPPIVRCVELPLLVLVKTNDLFRQSKNGGLEFKETCLFFGLFVPTWPSPLLESFAAMTNNVCLENITLKLCQLI